jgi:hypothetical protein
MVSEPLKSGNPGNLYGSLCGPYSLDAPALPDGDTPKIASVWRGLWDCGKIFRHLPDQANRTARLGDLPDRLFGGLAV